MPLSRRRTRKKIHGLPSSRGMDRNERCRITAYARVWNAAHRQQGQHTGPITRTFMTVLQALVFGFANTKTGSCFPSYEAIAKRAGCCRSSAIEAVNTLEAAGIVRVWARLKRVKDRVLMTSNAYTFRPIGVGSENPARTQDFKESVFLASRTPPIVSQDELNSPLMRALNRLGASIERKDCSGMGVVAPVGG